MIALKKPKATKCMDHCTVRHTAHTAKTAVRILRGRTERKIGDVFGKDQLAFRRGKGTRDAIGMLRITAEQNFEHR
jgi:hypothetical protein